MGKLVIVGATRWILARRNGRLRGNRIASSAPAASPSHSFNKPTCSCQEKACYFV